MTDNLEHDGVTLNVNPDGWPDGLIGIRIGDQNFFNINGTVAIKGYPIWDMSSTEAFKCVTCGSPRLSTEQCETCGELDVE